MSILNVKSKSCASIKNVLFLSLVLLLLVGCKKRIENTGGHFELRDGVDTYIEEGQVIRNSLVMDEGKLYYTDEEGHKRKDSWQKIDNDGNFGYFGSLGDLVIDKIRDIDGKLYYFDKEGILYTDRTSKKVVTIDGVEYIANKDGELRYADEVLNATKAPTTKAQTVAVTNNVQQIPAVVPIETAAISTNAPFAPYETTIIAGEPGPGSNIVVPQTTNDNVTNPTAASSASGEVKILKTEKVIDTVEGDEYDCKITLLKPVLSGKDDEETTVMNECIDEVMDAFMTSVIDTVEKMTTLPKSATITSATLGTVKKASITVNLTGNIKPKTGSTRTIKYRITYNREEQNADVTKVS